MKNIIKFFIEDLKTDFIFLKEVLRGEHKPKYKLKEWLSMDGILTKQNLIWYLIIIVAFFCGWILASAKYEVFVNNYILENCGVKENVSSYFQNLTWRR